MLWLRETAAQYHTSGRGVAHYTVYAYVTLRGERKLADHKTEYTLALLFSPIFVAIYNPNQLPLATNNEGVAWMSPNDWLNQSWYLIFDHGAGLYVSFKITVHSTLLYMSCVLYY